MNGLKMKYFVLKPAGNNEYARASRVALQAYARVIGTENPELSQDLADWAYDCANPQQDTDMSGR